MTGWVLWERMPHNGGVKRKPRKGGQLPVIGARAATRRLKPFALGALSLLQLLLNDPKSNTKEAIYDV